MIKVNKNINSIKNENNKISLKGKKLLILSGGFLNESVVEEAKKLGILTYVVDNNDNIHSPVKAKAYKSFNIDIYDVDKLVDLCKKEKIDGVLSLFYNVPSATYYALCKKMNYYCFASQKQYEDYNSKNKFKNICKKCKINIPLSYKISDLNKKFNSYPILIKPDDCSGSKGQRICYNYDEVKDGIDYAKKYSKNGKVIIEEYIDVKYVVTIECLIKNGEIATLNVMDMYNGEKKLGFDRVYELLIVSEDTKKLYKKSIEANIKKLIKANNIKNTFCVIQGMKSENSLKIMDSSLRLGGSTFCCNYASKYVNVNKIAIEYALTGKINCDIEKIKNCYEKNKKILVIKYFLVREGKIARIEGLEKLKKNKHVVNIEGRLYIGDIVKETKDVKQIFCGILLSFDSKKELVKFFEKDNFNIRVYDKNDNNMIIDDFDRCKKIIEENYKK